MKKILFLMLFTSSFLLWGQKIDANAKTILDNASAQLSKSSTFYIKFNYLYTVPEQKSTTEVGQIYAAGNKYHLILPSITQISDGSKIYTISKDDKEITISNPEDGDGISPINILNLYKKGFNISSEGSSTVNGVKCSLIKLVPTNNKSKSIVLAIANNKIVRVSENYNDGSSLILTITDFKENIIVNKSLLSFDSSKYPDYTITNL
ncbi:outer membrane lipoprotein carrier protein LolA [Apibacter muscae]|uniref:LolA family protein n=1 Tax=Apibacter muscae TaxID=2509004 RepID=UPI0011AD3867|nr:outer membrane lipoprotein carrier protein LolA [Apibacter muscae]TWP24265.1 outer membrane lipoprotein carrier protein LolA [Apibacter muscae]